MWIYIDPSTAYHDARIGEHFDGIIFVRDITPTHPTENALKTTPPASGASSPDTSRLALACCRLRPGIMWSSSSRQVRLTLPAGRPPLVSGIGTPATASETRTGCRGRTKVSNELSNYCGADRQPRLEDRGSFGAPGIGIDDHLGVLHTEEVTGSNPVSPTLRNCLLTWRNLHIRRLASVRVRSACDSAQKAARPVQQHQPSLRPTV
jgi:hypothetical protein